MPGQFTRTVVRAYYALAGLIVGVMGMSGIWNGVSAASQGCHVVFSQADVTEPPKTGPIPPNFPMCQQYVNLLAIVLGLAAAIVLVMAALRLLRTDRWSRLVVGIGALLGIAVGAFPMYLIWWASDYYNSANPDALGLLVGTPPLLIGLGAAWVTWQVHVRQEDAARPIPG